MKNKQLRKTFRDKPCLVCFRKPSEFCHIQTYATTLSDSEENAMPLCRFHHVEQGQIGIVTFVKKYPMVWRHVQSIGFEIDHRNKLVKKA